MLRLDPGLILKARAWVRHNNGLVSPLTRTRMNSVVNIISRIPDKEEHDIINCSTKVQTWGGAEDRKKYEGVILVFGLLLREAKNWVNLILAAGLEQVSARINSRRRKDLVRSLSF